MYDQEKVDKYIASRMNTSVSDDRHKVAERRQTDRGLLLVYHDFENYKKELAAAKDAELIWDRGLVEDRGLETEHTGTTRISWPWEPEFNEPESCVDWQRIENLARDDLV